MVHLALSFFIVTATGPGEIKTPQLDAGSEIFVSSQDCTVRLVGQRITGEPGCDVKIAIVDSKGAIKRHNVRLPLDTDDDDNAEDRPISSAIAPASSTSAAVRPAEQQTDSGPQFKPLFGLGFGRDISSFGLADVGLQAGVQYGDSIRFQVTWRRGLARTQTDLLDIARKIELTSDMLIAKVGVNHPLRQNLSGYADLGVGSGRLKSESISDDRNQLSTATQSFILYRPSLGLEWSTGRVLLGLGWQWTFAEGNWFPADQFGSADSDIPPENSGMMTQGIELNLGVRL